MGRGIWLAAPRKSFIFDAPVKIVVRQTGDSIISTIIEGGIIARDNLHIAIPKENLYKSEYCLGILNSKLMDFAYTFMNPEKGEALAQVKKHHVEQLPIRTIDLCNPEDKIKHDKMVKLVERILDLHKQLSVAKVPATKTRIQRQIEATDREIDQLVYELYGLTDDEIKIVEEASASR